jgi:hypothetical protein
VHSGARAPTPFAKGFKTLAQSSRSKPDFHGVRPIRE